MGRFVRRSPCEWLTAATPKLIGFSSEDFRLLELRRQLQGLAEQSSSPAELMDAFQPALRNRPIAEPLNVRFCASLFPALHCRGFSASDASKMAQFGSGISVDEVTRHHRSSVDKDRLAQIPIGDPLRLFV